MTTENRRTAYAAFKLALAADARRKLAACAADDIFWRNFYRRSHAMDIAEARNGSNLPDHIVAAIGSAANR